MNSLDAARRILKLLETKGGAAWEVERTAAIANILAPEVAIALIEKDAECKQLEKAWEDAATEATTLKLELVGARSREEEHYKKLCEAVELLKDLRVALSRAEYHSTDAEQQRQKIGKFLEGEK